MNNKETQITPEQAYELYPKTGILILLDLPKNLRLGLDNTSFEITEKFKGFKLIPPGAHYLHYTDHTTEGEFFWVQEGEVKVLEWIGDDNTLCSSRSWKRCSDKEKEDRLIAAAKNLEIDAYLAPYQYQQARMWKESTFYITKNLLKRIKI